MTPHFIEVHQNGLIVSMCLEQIIGFGQSFDERTYICSVGNYWVGPDETYAELKDLISHCGCHIAMRDPRLDTAHPISWDDLTKLEMIGEPVWDSNQLRWLILADSDGLKRSWIDLTTRDGKLERWIEHDVLAKPLYRIYKEC